MSRYYYTFSTIQDHGRLMPQTTAQTARNACPVNAALYRQTDKGAFVYLGVRCTEQRFVRVPS